MRTLLLLPLGITLAACGGETPTDTPPPTDLPVVRPSSVDTLSLGLKTHELPTGLNTVHVATYEGTTLVGGESGLYELTAAAPALIDAGRVTSLVAVDGVGIVVGQAEGGVAVWNGSLAASPLTEENDTPAMMKQMKS